MRSEKWWERIGTRRMRVKGGGRRWLFFGAKLAISAGLIAYLVRIIDLQSVWQQLVDVNPVAFFSALILLVLGQMLCAWRWAWLAHALGMTVAVSKKVELYFLGMFLSLFLPSIIGGDAARGLILARRHKGMAFAAWASVLLERINGVYGLSLLVTLAAIPLNLPHSWVWTWLLAMVVLWGGMGTYRWWGRFLPGIWRKLPLGSKAFRTVWWRALLASLLFQVMVVQSHVLLGRAVGLDLSWPAYALMVCLTALASALPVSVNGLGVREVGYVSFAAFLGGDANAAAAMAVLWLAVLAMAAAPGAAVLWRLGGLAWFTGSEGGKGNV